MLNHISDEIARTYLVAWAQLNREGEIDAILSFDAGLDNAVDTPMAT